MSNDTLQHREMRKRLVDTIISKGISQKKVISAIGKIPRHLFMENSFVKFAYQDNAFPIGAGQTISQPFTVAMQTELLNVKANDKVLEIGTGSGYQAAVLLEMGVEVYTIERQQELYAKAQQLLTSLGYRPHCFFGDGYNGLPDSKPFAGIIVTAGAPFIPEALKQQLAIGGRLVIPVDAGMAQVMKVVHRLAENEYDITNHGCFTFVPLLKGTN